MCRSHPNYADHHCSARSLPRVCHAPFPGLLRPLTPTRQRHHKLPPRPDRGRPRSTLVSIASKGRINPHCDWRSKKLSTRFLDLAALWTTSEQARAALEQAYKNKGYQTVSVEVPPRQGGWWSSAFRLTRHRWAGFRVRGSGTIIRPA